MFAPGPDRLVAVSISCALHFFHLKIKSLIMAAQQGRPWYFASVVTSFFLFSSPILSGQTLDPPYFNTWSGLSANLECMSEVCCMDLTENTGYKSYAKNRNLCTIAWLCWAISSQLRHVSTIAKKPVKLSSQYCEFWPTNGWDRLVSLRHHR